MHISTILYINNNNNNKLFSHTIVIAGDGNHSTDDPMCKLCGQTQEDVTHIISSLSMLAK